MELMAGTDAKLPLRSAIPETDGGFGHLGDRLTYAAAATLQAIACVVVITLQLLEIARRGTAVRRGGMMVFFVFLGFSLVIAGWLRLTEAAPYCLTFDLVREIMMAGSGLPLEFAREGFLLGQSRAFWAAIIPFALGALTVGSAASHAATLSAPDLIEGEEWEECFARRTRKLQNSFRASSFVLVTSAITLMLFLELPVGLADESTGKGLARFAVGLTMLWGSIMTLTLVAVFLPAFLVMRREAFQHHQQHDQEKPFRDWLEERASFQVKQQLANATTMLAPILVGPVGGLLQSTFGGG